MQTPSSTLIDLETKFWQSMVNRETDVLLNLLCEPALVLSSHGAMKFDHAGYRQMADHGSMVVHRQFSRRWPRLCLGGLFLPAAAPRRVRVRHANGTQGDAA